MANIFTDNGFDMTIAAGGIAVLADSISGTTTNDEATAGRVGEVLTNTADFATAGITATMTTASPTVVTMAAHGQAAGAAVWFTNSGGALGTGLVVNTNYYITSGSVTTNTFKLSSTMALAMAGTSDMNVTVGGTGTQTGHPGAILASATAADVVGVALTAGDWDVEFIATPTYQGSTSVTLAAAWVGVAGASSIPATSGALLTAGAAQWQSAAIVTPATNLVCATTRIKMAAAGILVGSVKSTFSVSTVAYTGLIRARRAR